jgi:hypothetical protein
MSDSITTRYSIIGDEVYPVVTIVDYNDDYDDGSILLTQSEYEEYLAANKAWSKWQKIIGRASRYVYQGYFGNDW